MHAAGEREVGRDATTYWPLWEGRQPNWRRWALLAGFGKGVLAIRCKTTIRYAGSRVYLGELCVVLVKMVALPYRLSLEIR